MPALQRVVLIGLLAILAGCAPFRPMYPVFDQASVTSSASPFIMKRPGATSEEDTLILDLPGTIDKLYAQRAAYQNQADQAQKALYGAGDGVMLGAVVGAVGGIVRNVATVASGAGIATLSSLAETRYGLEAQRNAYNDGARRTSCLISTATGFLGQTKAYEEWDPSLLSDHYPRVNQTLQQAAEDNLYLVRSSLTAISATPMNAAQIIALYQSLRPVSDTAGGVPAAGMVPDDDQRKALQEKLKALAENVQVDLKACVTVGQTVSGQ